MFRVELDLYRGPLDLLIYLVRKHEVQVELLSIAEIVRQFLDESGRAESLDLAAAADFLSLASTLLEMKSQRLLPRVEEPAEETLSDVPQELVRRLLEYKLFRDAATLLEDKSLARQQRFGRLADDLADTPAQTQVRCDSEIQLWDLVSAFSRLVKARSESPSTNIVYDETPIEVFMQRISHRVVSSKRLAFSELFQVHMHKSTMVGIFLAILELVRHNNIRAEQSQLFGEIWIVPGEIAFRPGTPQTGTPQTVAP